MCLKNKKVDIRETKSFQIEQAKKIGWTLEQYLGQEPVSIIYLRQNRLKQVDHHNHTISII